MDYQLDALGGPPGGRGSSHHNPDFCPDCGELLIRNEGVFYGEPFWWCHRCLCALVCNCEGCQVLRALRAL